MHIEDMSTSKVWRWLADHYPSRQAYLEDLNVEVVMVQSAIDLERIIARQKRWGEGILKLVEKAK